MRAGAPHEDRGRHGRRGGRALRGLPGEAHGVRCRGLPVVRGRHGGRKKRACVDGPVFDARKVVW
ncbi:MAG: hypothetical protein V8S24_05790 [Gordonibacter pamelaeae]